MRRGRITERSLYPAMMEVIQESGGSSVQEVAFDTEPDIVFELGDYTWLLSVKIGDDARTLKNAFIQYLQHKEDSPIRMGLIVLFPSSVRSTPPEPEAVRLAIETTRVVSLINAGDVKRETATLSFPAVIRLLATDVIPDLQARRTRSYSLQSVVNLLREHVSEMMEELPLDQSALLRIVTDARLLADIGDLDRAEVDAVGRFLASYILLSQIMFLRLMYAAAPGRFPFQLEPPSRSRLRRAFARILDVNYRDIYAIDVLDAVPDRFVESTFRLIWGLEVERLRQDLPGRIFHELMPPQIRKMLAAFYTRPVAAELIARLCIEESDATVFDPACGSGTILVAAYKRKLELFHDEGRAGSPHQRFCEQELFGADIMPFATHLTTANLAAMDPAQEIARTLIMLHDSLRLRLGQRYAVGLQLSLFPGELGETPTARTTDGTEHEVELDWVDVVLMNPPFTKVERGIAAYVDMERFRACCGGEVGLWGHFICLADNVLRERGILGAVLPINVLRGRESKRVRDILFRQWTLLYVIKATRNYGFSEWAEYRDVLIVARREPPPEDHGVRFCLVKEDLSKLTETNVRRIASAIKQMDHLRSPTLDIDTHPLAAVHSRMSNLMWFISGVDFALRERLVSFVERFRERLARFPARYFREGYRPVPRGVSKFMFVTRSVPPDRAQQAFLSFLRDDGATIAARSAFGVRYILERECFVPTLRTAVGLDRMDISDRYDLVAVAPYDELDRVTEAAGFRPPANFDWTTFWQRVQTWLDRIQTRVVVVRRINPFSPNTRLSAFYSTQVLAPSNQVNVIAETAEDRAKALCVILNSALFWAYFFLLKEETTGRWIDVRFYDLHEMRLHPPDSLVPALARLFDEYADVPFPSLSEQFDMNFEARYQEFWRAQDGTGQAQADLRLGLASVLDTPVAPSPVRLEFDRAVCQAIGVDIADADLFEVYDAIVREMIITRRLARD